MAEYVAPEYAPPTQEVWEKAYNELNRRRQGSFYSAQRITEELCFYQSTIDGKRAIRILDVAGAEGDVVCKALGNVPDLEVELVTVVEPSQRYVDLYSKNIDALNAATGRKIILKSVVDKYDLETLRDFHSVNGMESRYDIVLLVHGIYYTGQDTVPELRDHFLKPETGHLLVICGNHPFKMQNFVKSHYERFYPAMNASTTTKHGNPAEDLLHFALHSDSCFYKSYRELFDVSDIVSGDDIASGNEKGRDFLHYLMQRDLDPTTPAGDLELRIYVKWLKTEAVPYHQDRDRGEKLKLRCAPPSLDGSCPDQGKDRYFLPWPTTLYRLTSETMKDTLTVTSAREAAARWSQKW